MNQDSNRHRHDLRAIARRAMIDRGLLPDFAPEVQAELSRLKAPEAEEGPPPTDLRDLLWVSIDNDDSRDLDQLSYGEAAGPGQTKILVAIADGNVKAARAAAIEHHRNGERRLIISGVIKPSRVRARR